MCQFTPYYCLSDAVRLALRDIVEAHGCAIGCVQSSGAVDIVCELSDDRLGFSVRASRLQTALRDIGLDPLHTSWVLWPFAGSYPEKYRDSKGYEHHRYFRVPAGVLPMCSTVHN